MNRIAWTGRGNILIARVVMNGVPLFVAYNRSSRFLGLRVDTQVDMVDMSTPGFVVRNGAIFASKRDVNPEEILEAIFDMLHTIPVLASPAQA